MYKVRIMISDISALAKKNTRILYTCGRIPYISVHISVYIPYTVCNRRYTGRYVEGLYTEFYSCGRIPYMSVHILVYVMYTACNRRYTGRHVEGVYTKFYSWGRIPSSSGHMLVYNMYTGRIMGYAECGVEDMCTDFVDLMNNDPWFLAVIKFVFRTVTGRVFRHTNLRFISLKTPFSSILSLLFLIGHVQIKTWSISILNSTQRKLSGAFLARTIQMGLLCTATCILYIKCPLICNRNTRLKCGLRVPFSLASVATRTWSSLAGNDFPDCNLRGSITSFFQALNHFFLHPFWSLFRQWQILLELLQPAVLPQNPISPCVISLHQLVKCFSFTPVLIVMFIIFRLLLWAPVHKDVPFRRCPVCCHLVLSLKALWGGRKVFLTRLNLVLLSNILWT